jgi:hypothetical protein
MCDGMTDHAVIHVFVWGNNARRAELRGRRCIVEARGAMSTVLVRFLDTGERVTTSHRALRRRTPEVHKRQRLLADCGRVSVRALSGSGTQGLKTTRKGSHMPRKGDVHVVPADKGWRVEVDSQGRAIGTHDTQAAAWKQARGIARRNESEALLHGRDGKIRERNTYGRDPRRSKG